MSAGQDCVARWGENHVWYRVRIAEVGQDGKVLVAFTDYGSFAYVGERDLVAEAEGIPEGEEKDVYLMQAAADDGEVIKPYVEEECVRNENAEHVRADDDIETVAKVELGFLGGEQVDLGLHQQWSTQTFIQDVEDSELIIEASDSNLSGSICEGESCLAIWAEDGVLYRAILKTWLPGGLKAEVHFIDYDNKDEVGIENLFRDYSCVPEEMLQSDLVDFNVGAHIRLLLASSIC